MNEIDDDVLKSLTIDDSENVNDILLILRLPRSDGKLVYHGYFDFWLE